MVDRLPPFIIYLPCSIPCYAAAGLGSTACPAELACYPSLPYCFLGSPLRHFRLTCCLGRAAMCMRNRSVQ